MHLVLEVHVAEAIASATDRDVARLEADLQKAGMTGATVGKTDPAQPQTIVVSGVPAAKLSDARSVLQGNDYPIYDVATHRGWQLDADDEAGGDQGSRDADAGYVD